MTNKRDLETESDIQLVLEQFYADVVNDEILLRYFEHLDINAHLPKILGFWSGLLLNTGNYSGNMIELHQRVHVSVPLSPLAFERWLALFVFCIDKNYKGFKADEMKTRARSIAGVLCFRITGQVLNV